MMGQWTVKEAGSAVRRLVVMAVVAALMAAMLAASAMPAFASPPQDRGGDNFGGNFKGNGLGHGGTSLSNGSGQGIITKEECGVLRNPHLSRLPGGTVC
jgi:hypothetical protein